MPRNASTCSAEIAATTSTPWSGSAKSKIFSCFMNGRNRGGNSSGWSPRCSLAYIFSSVPWAKQSSDIRGFPAAIRRRFTSRSTTVFMNAWCAIASPNVSPVVASISSIQPATSSVSRARYAATSASLMLCQR
jgi:hypothetical protein